MGTHQKIDRVARKHLAEVVENDDSFPSIKDILLFEGKNGPDGIKKKSPSHNGQQIENPQQAPPAAIGKPFRH